MQNEESKVNEGLTGTPRKRLEGEIGKIEGVYNVGQRGKAENEDIRNLRKHNTGSGASSDYDKAGQSSSNADSGRGSAAYSSGRRPGCVDLPNDSDNFVQQNTNYREHHSSSKTNSFLNFKAANQLKNLSSRFGMGRHSRNGITSYS